MSLCCIILLLLQRRLPTLSRRHGGHLSQWRHSYSPCTQHFPVISCATEPFKLEARPHSCWPFPLKLDTSQVMQAFRIRRTGEGQHTLLHQDLTALCISVQYLITRWQ